MSNAIPLTNDLLKGVMTDALVYRGIVLDINTCLTPGYYQVQSQSTKNIPTGAYQYGILTVKKTASFITQEYIPHSKFMESKFKIWIRTWTENRFNNWLSYSAD